MRARTLLPTLALAACAGSGTPPALRGPTMTPIEISEADSGKAVRVAPGQAVAVRLPENPGTGYGWRLLLPPGSPWQLVSTAFSAAPEGRAGAAGTRTWLLHAARGGEARLRFDLRRPWGHEPPVQQLEFELVAE